MSQTSNVNVLIFHTSHSALSAVDLFCWSVIYQPTWTVRAWCALLRRSSSLLCWKIHKPSVVKDTTSLILKENATALWHQTKQTLCILTSQKHHNQAGVGHQLLYTLPARGFIRKDPHHVYGSSSDQDLLLFQLTFSDFSSPYNEIHASCEKESWRTISLFQLLSPSQCALSSSKNTVVLLHLSFLCLTDSRRSGAAYRLAAVDADGRSEAELSCHCHGRHQQAQLHRRCAASFWPIRQRNRYRYPRCHGPSGGSTYPHKKHEVGRRRWFGTGNYFLYEFILD